jgi:hypothetical protein
LDQIVNGNTRQAASGNFHVKLASLYSTPSFSIGGQTLKALSGLSFAATASLTCVALFDGSSCYNADIR